MDVRLQDNTLLDSNEKYDNMVRLIILKQAAAWLEKQDWFSNPYGGQNPMQDLIFQTQLTANRIWEDFFSKKMDPYSAEELKRQILELGDLTPELQSYFEHKLKPRLQGNL
jgi:hypothetical protein